jgi:hypothetical protein
MALVACAIPFQNHMTNWPFDDYPCFYGGPKSGKNAKWWFHDNFHFCNFFLDFFLGRIFISIIG